MATLNIAGTSERQLVPRWAPELVVLSYCISWLGAYTSTQIVIHAKYTRNRLRKWVWVILASLAYGFCAIWSMHFVGMLACRLDVKIGFDAFLTILSALVAVIFTFAALSSGCVANAIEHRVSTWNRSLRTSLTSSWNGPFSQDPEAGYEVLNMTDDDEDELEGRDDNMREALGRDHHRTLSPEEVSAATSVPRGLPRKMSYSLPSYARSSTVKSPLSSPHQGSQQRHSEESAIAPSVDSTSTSNSLSRCSVASSGETLATGSPSWDGTLHVEQSRETGMHIKARPLPDYGWREWGRTHYEALTLLVAVRAAIWGMALVLMHYCGMWAMYIPSGRVAWNLGIVMLSYVVAFAVCLLACITMEHMEVHFGRQVAFSTIAAFGCCSMHYTGMAAATFYTYSPPSEQAGYPTYLPFTIIGVAVLVCVVSNVILAHSAIIARNRMTEMILTKRRLWRIMAEKEAAEQANELKQQFISVASHEIRTPLHTVNGYCELLSRADLTEEQLLYVSSIQQACHALNVIAGNVLDFSKLDRDNLELSARPVPMQLRRMVEDLARITDARGIQPGQPVVDVIMSVAKDVPQTVYLDETYTFRVLMNLLSNAQKFCEQGYICVAISMAAPDQLLIKVSDTGVGIPVSFRAALFEPFRQADTSLTRPRQGTGLGLSIVKQLVQRMSGTVNVESTEGEGTMFTVRLPITPSAPSRPASPIPEAPSPLSIAHSHPRTQELLVSLWPLHGHAASAGVSDPESAEALWADVESIARAPALRALLGGARPVYVVHSNAHDLALLGPELARARNVVLVKRPVILHEIAEKMAHPEAHMGVHITKGAPRERVRFALPAEKAGATLSREYGGRDMPFAGNVGSTELRVIVDGMEKAKVLLVEDNLINQRLGCRLLEKLGYEVITANDGQKAVDAVKLTFFHCCLMDCQMPVLDGFATTRLIREAERDGTFPGRLPIIALTANVTSDSEERCRQAGMDHFLPKPLKLADLEVAIRQHGR